ncbi:hypothetical protein, variant [Saprolegnia diclina VS20]|uniref:tRNA (guanine(26)-N(2))-dimethyltransferase n=1 Tax=Saprolegnia diclina (strain VS20) TaxID=1156394 RepID=T0Q2G9_SAPDV|nr:hypothetical protein, variant [Saprolegnia diclina VS20]EQC28761.1 hypothetical protein, variant [Saprolegnia diclina VS20]|eukprot:XP_008617756.1 hypothetical protein, variant [Saprolegnia diclina VS20]
MAAHAEGRATIAQDENVFLSAHQELQRDLTVLVLQALAAQRQLPRSFAALDAMAGTGIRAIRYALEVPGALSVANDLDAAAHAAIVLNIAENGVSDRVQATRMDAVECLWKHRERFHVVDLDPFGTCAALLPSAIASVAVGGVVCATDTDMHTLLGKNGPSHAECFRRYGALPHPDCNRSVTPLLSTAFDFFTRVIFRVQEAGDAPRVPLAVVDQCTRCAHFDVHELGADVTCAAQCPICNNALQRGGPFWMGPLQERNVLSTAASMPGLDAARRYLDGILLEEPSAPFYYSVPRLFRAFKHVQPPSLAAFKHALRSIGHDVTTSHLDPMSIKTRSTSLDVYGVVKAWLVAQAPSTAELPSLLPSSQAVFSSATRHRKDEVWATPTKCTRQHMEDCSLLPPSSAATQLPSTSLVSVGATDDLASAIEAAHAGATLSLAPASYIVSTLRIGKAITLQGTCDSSVVIGHIVVEGNASVVLDGLVLQPPKRPTPKTHTLLVSSGRVLIERCVVQRSAPNIAVVCVANRSHVVMRHSRITDGLQAGLYVCGKATVDVLHCTVERSAGCGVDVSGGAACILSHSTVANCKKSGVFVHAFGTLTMRDCRVEKNCMAGVEGSDTGLSH